ncbi:hypothetical protein [Methylobacterium oxalidis]|uniref:hypothetical protein n=1 Tax=Methylobacterium oxalidis TaxID=944322 RepID=UPI0033151890
MPDTPIVPAPSEKPDLPHEWIDVAELAAKNLGLSRTLAELSPEHWQLVLASVTDRMRLRGASLPVGWRRTLARQVGRATGEQVAAHVVALRAKREEIAAHVAQELGLGELATLNPIDRATVDQQTDETIEACSPDAPVSAECSDADRTMRRLLAEHRALKELKPDEADAH